MGWSPPLIRLLVLATLLTGCGKSGCGERVPEDWIAQVERIKGTVRFSDDRGGLVPALPGVHLRVGSRLETGPASEASLTLRNGGRLAVKPNSVVLFSSELPRQRIGLAVRRGSVVGTSPNVEAAELVIGVGERTVRLPQATEVTISAPGAQEAEPRISVTFGTAMVAGPDGKEVTLVAGKELVLTSKPVRAPPDAGPPVVRAPELVFLLKATGKGRVLIRAPGEGGFHPVRPGEVVRIVPGTAIRLMRRAQIHVGPEKGAGTFLSGPAQLVAMETPPPSPGAAPGMRLESTEGTLLLTDEGKPGKVGPGFTVDGVTLSTRITHQRLAVRVKREKGRSLVVVAAGEATLAGKSGSLRLEAGQEGAIARGKITGPQLPPAGPLEVRGGGRLRVFITGPSTPLTFRWPATAGVRGSLVEISRSASLDRPLFADVIQRRVLTLPQVGQGGLYWQIRPIDGEGRLGKPMKGQLMLVRDTSHRSLKDRQAPRNTIQESFGNTTVFYQNLLPRFTFRWEGMETAASYQMKIFREQQLSQPVFVKEGRGTSAVLPAGKLGEGSYLWYVVGRASNGALVKTSDSRKLTIRYDNATPDLQIVYPPHGITVSADTLEVRGVAIPGSRVSVNGVPASLDETYRFSHPVSLRAGINHIIFLVVDPRRGSSTYLRRVTRQ